jgi:hypothetical protein
MTIHEFDSHTIFSNMIYPPLCVSAQPLVFEIIYARRNKIARTVESSDVIQLDLTNMRIQSTNRIPKYIQTRILELIHVYMVQQGMIENPQLAPTIPPSSTNDTI